MQWSDGCPFLTPLPRYFILCLHKFAHLHHKMLLHGCVRRVLFGACCVWAGGKRSVHRAAASFALPSSSWCLCLCALGHWGFMQHFLYVKNGIQKELGFSFTCRGSSGRARDILALPFQHNSADFSHFRPWAVSQRPFTRTKLIWSEHSMVKNGEQMFAFRTAPLLSLQLPVLEADFSPISAMGILNDQPLKKCSANPGGGWWSCAGAEGRMLASRRDFLLGQDNSELLRRCL